jgi:hypothetical protein
MFKSTAFDFPGEPMNFSAIFARVAIVAAALTLAACGGKATFPVTGTVTGLLYSGLTLSTNGMSLTVDKDAKTFSFPNTLSYGDVYNVLVATQPQHQTCNTVDPTTGRETGTDTAGRLASVSIVVTCAINSRNIGGNITVVDKAGNAATLAALASNLVLTNGTAGGIVTIVPAATTATYVFGTQVAYNVSYGVTVLTQPTNAVCTVTNGAGVMADTDVTNIAVACQLT